MSESVHVVGFKPPDDKWKKMKAVWDACKKANIDVPDDVLSFFEYVEPDPLGVEIDLEKTNAAEKYNEEMKWGWEINVAKLPKDVTVLRFYVSH
jgi:hypothetical protein